MNNLSPMLQMIKEILEAHHIPVFIGKEWNDAYLSTPITVNKQKHRTVSARFSIVEGQPALTYLPEGRYVCVRIPCFYHWWDDLHSFQDVLQKANAIAYSVVHREVQLDFFIDFVDADVIFFRMDVMLKENEKYNDAVMDVYDQLCSIAAAVYAYLEQYAKEFDEEDRD